MKIELADRFMLCVNIDSRSGYCHIINNHIENGIASKLHCSNCNHFINIASQFKLNLGCGYDIKKGYINIDYVKNKGIDVVYNLDKFPYPFKDESADEILLKDSLEHLSNPIKTLKECHRILKKRGIIKIKLPHFSYYRAFNPEHKTYWHLGYFKAFEENTKIGSAEQFEIFRVRKQKIYFLKGLLLHNYLLEFLVNLNIKTQRTYEANFAFIFPASHFEVELEKKLTQSKQRKNEKN